MNDDIRVLLEFHGSCSVEASGHAAQMQPDGQMALFDRFITGESSDDERQELARFLMENPHWIRWLAEKVKMNRETGDSSMRSEHGEPRK